MLRLQPGQPGGHARGEMAVAAQFPQHRAGVPELAQLIGRPGQPGQAGEQGPGRAVSAASAARRSAPVTSATCSGAPQAPLRRRR